MIENILITHFHAKYLCEKCLGMMPFYILQEANEALLHGYSTEELSQEMANLEGLMKDLSAITANQFNC